MATKFVDIAKPAKDLLNEDYTNKVTLKAKKPAGPITVTIETEQDKNGFLTSKIGTKFAYAKFSVDKGQIKADGGRVVETSLAVSPECKVNFKGTKGVADMGLEYTKGPLAATAVIDIVERSKISASACYGLPSGVLLGLDATYGISGSSKGLSSFNYGFAYAKGPMFASVTATSKNIFTIGLLYKVSPSLSLASETIHSKDKMLDVAAVGGAYKLPSLGTLKAKMGADGVLNACLISEIAPKVTFTASGSVSTKDFSTFKPGFMISM